VEYDDLVDSIEKLRFEETPQCIHHPSREFLFAQRIALLEYLTSKIGSHYHDRIAKIYSPTLGISQSTVVEELQENVENIGMRLLYLIEEHH